MEDRRLLERRDDGDLAGRVQRIAHGAGVAPRDVKELLRNYETSRKAIKGFAGNRKMRKQILQQLEASGVDVGE